ncbi:MAG TPA: hypothetical protein VLM85_23715, partial [Polyangiaceae bacterium]|nr:hypothetical protein [Polyangiaceae bacterium]
MRIAATTLLLTATLACSWAAPARADEPDDTEVECQPACRSGYVCVDGECKSACNPPCASNERCTAKAACVRLARQRQPDTSDDDDDDKPSPTRTPARKTEPTYRPSVGRVYVGPMMLALAFRGVLLADPGASLALDFH